MGDKIHVPHKFSKFVLRSVHTNPKNEKYGRLCSASHCCAVTYLEAQKSENGIGCPKTKKPILLPS